MDKLTRYCREPLNTFLPGAGLLRHLGVDRKSKSHHSCKNRAYTNGLYLDFHVWRHRRVNFCHSAQREYDTRVRDEVRLKI